ncbi:MAG: hypothetical protein ACT6R2_07475 [Blastomonas fulva]|jgi:hypothetical protein|uniref:Uncharacterized protein n=1 Tax=Blastomonas fulva TaxID=1550728 RepID=A0ABN5B3Y3_9SPHN|nr:MULTISPECIES: hypothetical protein [Blastomonas]AOG00073.1 hypothetical protein BSY18_203 [Blastomonas sp. RAC04]ASR51757.1 hypothetical protein B5J99_10035 [Blastomonas fulva]KPF76679.1 hypothetical protein IP68_01910 [Blastomonas sp. AAP25]MCO5794443.1 hypothetical protein [Blastomonas sp.]MDK2755395.1 hypothetical protein [Blastomonas fulva]
MVLSLFESAEQRRKDDRELDTIHKKYGDTTVDVLDARARDESLTDRERKHWSRLLRKARQRFRD